MKRAVAQNTIKDMLRPLRPAPYSLLEEPSYAELVHKILKGVRYLSDDCTSADLLRKAGE